MLPMLVLNHLPESSFKSSTLSLQKAFTVNPIGLQAHPQGNNLADNSLGGVECTAHNPGSGGMADIVSVTMPLLSIEDLAVAIFHQNGAC